MAGGRVVALVEGVVVVATVVLVVDVVGELAVVVVAAEPPQAVTTSATAMEIRVMRCMAASVPPLLHCRFRLA